MEQDEKQVAKERKKQERQEKRMKLREELQEEGKALQASAASNPCFLFDFLFIRLVVLDFPLPNSASSAAFPLPTNVSVFHRPLETPKETSVQSTGRSLKSILTFSSDSEESGELEENSKGKMENSKEQLENSKEQLANSKEQNNPSIDQSNPNETPTDHQSNSIDHSNEPLIHSPSLSSTPSDSIESDLEPIIEFSKDAPAAPILGPFCVICGKFGQYVCDRTDQEICSLECKRKAEAAALSSTDSPTQTPSIPTHSLTPHNESEVLRVLPTAPQFVPSKNRWKDAISPLDSRKCPICGKTGHLAQDCHFASGKLVEFVGFGRNEEIGHRIECDSLPEWQRREVSGNEFMTPSYRRCSGNAEKRSVTPHRAVLSVENEET